MTGTTPPLLQGRLALVTGAGQGIGRAVAEGLSAAGARVVVTDVHEPGALETADAIRRKGGTAWHFVLDVVQSDQCRALAARLAEQVGQVDLLVNNAGILLREGADSPHAERNWRRTFDVNVHGTFNVTQAFLPALRGARGTIVNVASLTAFVGQAGAAGYSPSKGAIKMYTQTLAIELAPDGVRVNAVAPGLIATPMNAEARQNADFVHSRLSRIPLGRVGTPEDLVGPVIFLSSSLSGYVTGVTLAVDGGFLAM